MPYVAISLFAGLRAAELQKLDWAEIDLDGGHIEVTAAKSKTSRRRLVPVADNLRAWLEPLAQIAGPVAPIGLRKRFDGVKEAAGFKVWESNSMRHTFGSYRLAQCQDAAKVSLEMGTSPANGIRALQGACEAQGRGAVLGDHAGRGHGEGGPVRGIGSMKKRRVSQGITLPMIYPLRG